MIDIYTCITAGYDDLKKQPVLKDTHYIAFVEGVTRPLPPWNIVPVPSVDVDPTRRAREMKVLSHQSLPGATYSLWVDGCFIIGADFNPHRWVREYMQDDIDLVTFQHTEHDCTYQHANRVIQVGLDRALTVAAQMLRYREAGLPDHAGMVQTNVILRRHTPAVACFNEKWWAEIQAGSRRDQLSFIHAARETGLGYAALPVHERQYFHGKSHRGVRTSP